MKGMHRTLLLVCMLGLSACGPPDGELREVVRNYDGPKPSPIRVVGNQIFHDGEWMPHGAFVYYDKQGNITHQGQFDFGLESGDWSQLSKDGVTGIGSYNLGERHGSWIYSYASKLVREEGNYDNGKRIGVWTTYYSDGSVEGKIPYVDGKIEGWVQFWDSSGKAEPDSSGLFKNGERVLELAPQGAHPPGPR